MTIDYKLWNAYARHCNGINDEIYKDLDMRDDPWYPARRRYNYGGSFEDFCKRLTLQQKQTILST